MLNISVCSSFRDSMIWNNRLINQVGRFFSQLNEQNLLGKAKINKIACVEGNSIDNTYESLLQYKDLNKHLNVNIIKEESTNRSVGSFTTKERIGVLSRCKCLALDCIKDDCDYILCIESDLIIYDEFFLYHLLGAFDKIDKLGIIAPIITLDTIPIYFYDTWAFRDKNGQKWNNYWVWNQDYIDNVRYIEMTSIGSCSLIKADLIRNGCSFGDGDYPNMCKNIIDAGYKVYCDKRTNIFHPCSNNLINMRWT